MPNQKSAYRIVLERLKQAEDERRMLFSSFSTVSDWQLAHNKGMHKTYNTIREDLEGQGLANNTNMHNQKSAYRIVLERLKQVEDERRILVSSFLTVSDWQLAHNKGMRKAYKTIREDLEEQGLREH